MLLIHEDQPAVWKHWRHFKLRNLVSFTIYFKVSLSALLANGNVPPLLFKRLGKHIAEPLALIFASFFSIHQIPSEWSKSIVTPVFKTGSSPSVANYRPISLTCIACKLMERVISTEMFNYLREHNLVSKHQHGFMSRHSTVSNLLESLNDWTLASVSYTHLTLPTIYSV